MRSKPTKALIRLKPKSLKETSFNKALSLSHQSSRIVEVQSRAMWLCDTFKDEHSLKFFLKCSWHIPENDLVSLVERSKTKDNPRRYFLAAASREMNG